MLKPCLTLYFCFLVTNFSVGKTDNWPSTTVLPLGYGSCTNLIPGTNNGATDSGIPHSCGGFSAGRDVWFYFEAPASGEVAIETSDNNAGAFDTLMEVYEAYGGNSIHCDDDSGSSPFSFIQLTELTPGAIYEIDNGWVAYGGGDSGPINVSWNPQGSCNTPYLHVWDMNGVAGTELAPWPGTAMTDSDGDGNYDLSLPYDCANIIFNCAGSPQSGNIVNICGDYCYEGSADGGMSIPCGGPDPSPDVIISPVGGTYPDDPLSISLTLSDNSCCPIYYTTNGATPTTSSTLYSGSVTLPGTAGTTVTVKAVTLCNNMYSDVATETYTFEDIPPQVTSVIINPAGGTKPAGMLNVSLGVNNNSVCDIRYTLDGSIPNASSTLYTENLILNGTENTATTVRAIAYCGGTATSIATATYNFTTTPPLGDCFFTWDNATIYFVLTDRFNNVNTSNDLSYCRQPDPIGGFLGGDLQGLTAKINEGYFTDLGVNAIWITPPYEQIHGAVPGYWGPNGYPGESHYAYHGYHALDFTEVDNNYGTAADMEAFVDAAHAKGIRIIMDIVLNHVGYPTTADAAEFGLGNLGDPWVPDNPTLNADDPAWCNWWTDSNVNSWIRIGNTATDFCALACGGSDKKLCLAGLPDVLTELTTPVGIPKILENKWGGAGSSKYTTETAELNAFFSNNSLTATPANHIVKWLTDWVRDYGIDGFRIDTYKHVETPIWGTLKEQAQIALDEWRANNPAKPLAEQITPFWMVGELYGHGPNKNVDAVTNGKTDALINFTFQGQDGDPTALNGTYSSYAGLVADPEWNILSYISSHDTELSNRADLVDGGTSLLLAPGAVQIFYGDETGRQPSNSGSDQDTRSFMNWESIDNTVLSHWQKIGQFRKCHPAVGAGTHTKLGDAPYTFLREYINAEAGISDKVVVAVGASAGTPISVGGAIADGTRLRDAYTGEESTVSGGTVVYNNVASAGVVLMEPTNPCSQTLGNIARDDTDCANDNYSIDVIITDLGSAASIDILNDKNSSSFTAVGLGSYTLTGFSTADGEVTVSIIATNDPACRTTAFVTIPPNCPATNDDCANATPIPVGINTCTQPIAGTNVGATDSGVTHFCNDGAGNNGGYNGADIWYSIVVPTSGNVTIETGDNDSGTFDTVIQIYDSCNGATIACDDDGLGSAGFSIVELTDQTPGTVLYVAVWEHENNVVGSFNICAWTNLTDSDNDGIPDASDLDPYNPYICQDADQDGCEDCAYGVDGFGPLPDYNPNNDGPDYDNDGICDSSDTDDDNDGVADVQDAAPFDATVQ